MRVIFTYAELACRCFAVIFFIVSDCAAAACVRNDFPVAIDPGHTRTNPGAISARGRTEREFNELLASRFLDELLRAGFAKAFLTNVADDVLSLADRPRIAAARRAQLLVSIHHDSAQPHLLSHWDYAGKHRAYTDSFSGYSLFVSNRNGDPVGSLRFARLLGTQLRTTCLNPTLHHAVTIPGEGREVVDPGLGIYRFNDLAVLAGASMPAVLVEAGVIVNRRDELLLRSSSHRRKIALALAEAVIAYCDTNLPPFPPSPPNHYR